MFIKNITGPELSPGTDRAYHTFWSQLDLDDDDLMASGTYTAKAKSRLNRVDSLFDRITGTCSGGRALKGSR